MCKLELDFAIVAVLHSHYTLLVVSNGMAPWVQNMTPWLWESPIYINIFMNLAILPELLGLAKNRLNRPSTSGKIAKCMRIFI